MELAMFWIHHCFHAGSMFPNSTGLSTAGRQLELLFVFFAVASFIYLFFGCAGSLLLCELFSSWGVQASHCCGVSCYRARDPKHAGFGLWLLGSRAQAQQLWPMGLVAPWRVGSSWTRGWTPVSCTDGQILCHWVTREALESYSWERWDSVRWPGLMSNYGLRNPHWCCQNLTALQPKPLPTFLLSYLLSFCLRQATDLHHNWTGLFAPSDCHLIILHRCFLQ